MKLLIIGGGAIADSNHIPAAKKLLGIENIVLAEPNTAQVEKMFVFCKTLTEAYDNVTYLNLWEDSRFDEEDFYDSDHLSCDRGAIELSKILNEYIMSMQ